MTSAAALGPLYTAVMPIKAWDLAKSRLHAEPHVRFAFAAAFAQDALEAVLRCPAVGQVVVVTRDSGARRLALRLGAAAISEPSGHHREPLAAAVQHGVDWASRLRPSSPLAVIPADLPGMTSHDLNRFLVDASAHERAFASDSSGLGTTILVSQFTHGTPHGYGLNSSQRHRSLGFCEMSQVPAGLRRDVDVMADLDEANLLGLGSHTRRVLFHLTSEGPQPSRFVAVY